MNSLQPKKKFFSHSDNLSPYPVRLKKNNRKIMKFSISAECHQTSTHNHSYTQTLVLITHTYWKRGEYVTDNWFLIKHL